MTSSHRLRLAEKPFLRSDLPEVAVGDAVEVSIKVAEGDRERTQVFAGTVISIRGGGLGRTFTVRRIVAGEGVERVFPLHSPVIQSLQVTRKGRVRRARLTYLRHRVGKATRLREVIGRRDGGPDPSPQPPASGTVRSEEEALVGARDRARARS